MSERKPLIYTMEDTIEKQLHNLRNGLEKGTTTHIPDVDNCWRWRLGEANIWTGYQNEGKSQWLRYLCLIKALVEGWKFVFSAPEDFPAEEFYDDIIHTVCGQTTDKDNPNCVSEAKYKRAYNLLKPFFYFVYVPPPDNSIPVILNLCEELVAKHDIKGTIIDPLMKHARPKDAPDRDDLYAGYIDSILTDYARRNRNSTHLVMHQQTPTIDDNGLYPKPNIYKIKGGGSWSDGIDNVLFVQRPNYNKDKLTDTSVLIGSQKIKKHKLVAIPQELNISFDRKLNQYTDLQGNPLFNFKKYIQ